MSESFKNKIQRLELENFTCFSKAAMDFSSGINVFIGENGSGKTHVLKVLYLLSDKVNHEYGRYSVERLGEQFLYRSVTHDTQFSSKIDSIFKGKYNKLQRGKNKFEAFIGSENEISGLSAANYTVGYFLQISNYHTENFNINRRLFLPSIEMLSLYKGFAANYDERESSFDDTHYDLAKALSASILKNSALQKAQKLVAQLEQELGISVLKKDEQFYLKSKNEDLEVISLHAASGINKLAQVIYLILNGSLTKDTILFWDEPETNLNPKYIKIVAQFLQTLAKNGVQIFVATHDYLLAHLLSLAAEYRNQTDAPPMKFFSFYKGEDGTEIEAADTLADIENNSILDEYAAYYDLEQRLFKQTLQTA